MKDLNDIKYSKNKAIIINCSTKLCTTLALISTLKNAEIEVVLIDCESKDNSLAYFINLQNQYSFEIVSLPLKSHGQTLDYVFRNLNADNILLVDSDIELKSKEIIDFSLKYIDQPSVFGAGFLQMYEWMLTKNQHNEYENVGFYIENPYTPLTLLKRQVFLDALNEGFSFDYFGIKNNEGSFLKSIYNSIVSFLLKLRPNQSFNHELNIKFYGKKPYSIEYDTGAKIYEYLRYEKRLDFVGIPHRLQNLYIKHYSGITRYLMYPDDTNFTNDMKVYQKEIESRLLEVYQFDYKQFLTKLNLPN